MSKLRMILFLLAVLVAIWPGSVSGQTGEMMMERLRGEIQMTQEVLVRAWEVVQHSNDETAFILMKSAKQRQDWAIEQEGKLRHQFGLRLHSMAMSATGKAREQARNAIATVRRSDRNDGNLQRRMERARDLLEQARQVMAKLENRPGLAKLLDTAKDNLIRARDFYNEGRYRPALKLTNQVTRGAERLLRVVRERDRGWDEFERRQEGLRQMLQEIRSRADDCEGLLPKLKVADETRLKALALADEGQLKPALKQLRKANDLAQQAARDCRGQRDLEEVRDRLRQKFRLMWEVRADLSGDQANKYLAMLRQVEDQLAMADKHLNRNQYEAAKISLQAARTALNRAQRIRGGR